MHWGGEALIAPEQNNLVQQLIARHGRSGNAVLPMLHEVQDQFHYLPNEILEQICEQSQITPSQLIGVASFYDCFRTQPAGEHRIRICHGTACHVKGSTRVEEALRLHLGIAKGHDTDEARQYTLEPVACVGCCSLAPVVLIDDFTAGHLTARSAPQAIQQFERELKNARPASSQIDLARDTQSSQPTTGIISISLDSCCLVRRTDRLFEQVLAVVRRLGLPVQVQRVGCNGLCRLGAAMLVSDRQGLVSAYASVQPEDVEDLLTRHFQPAHVIKRLWIAGGRALDRLSQSDASTREMQRTLKQATQEWNASEQGQCRIATEHFGKLDPLDLDQYQQNEGFVAWRRCLLEMKPGELIELVKSSGLRGRGGGGYPTGMKWQQVADARDSQRYVICNGDEGDPGAFMDRMLMESFAYRVLEGLMLASFAVGANKAFVYVRHEYPLAVARLNHAIAELKQAGLLGTNILGTSFDLEIELREGAGAFVCGEETALIASIEGERGTPAVRPPYPSEKGLWGKPTLVNNVETLATIPWLVRHGSEALTKVGTPRSRGTKVFALAGSVNRVGLVEVPMGTTIREIVEQVGGGMVAGRRFKAVQIGGPSGGCLPASLADTPIDYEALSEAGAMMGSGGLIVLDDQDCMVDLARYFLQFTQQQSCGKCSFCRVGTKRMLEILERLCQGKAKRDELNDLEYLAHQVAAGSLCGLGATAPNPVLTTLRYFHDEYEAHLNGHCPAGRCSKLVRYHINDNCIGCTLCAQQCPVDAIAAKPYRLHEVEDELCTRCDICRQVCPHDAVEVVS